MVAPDYAKARSELARSMGWGGKRQGARSSLFLLLIRCSLRCLEIRRASKWAAALEFADRQDVHSRRLSGFLHNNGGIEGAARARAEFGRETSQRAANHARSPNAV
jgi:hypothetical protein